jgi:uncharacterized protein (TIGR03437 family)
MFLIRPGAIIFAPLFLLASVVSAQKTIPISYDFTLSASNTFATSHASAIGAGNIAGLGGAGSAAITVDLSQSEDPNNGNPLDDFKGTVNFAFNRLDSFDVSVSVPNGNGNPAPVTGNIVNGKGAYSGASGSMTISFSGVNGPRNIALKVSAYTISATGSVTVAGKTTPLTLSNTTLATWGSGDNSHDILTGAGTMTPFGAANITVDAAGGDNNTRQSVVITFSLNSKDSFFGFLTFYGSTVPSEANIVIGGGTGAYAGATGSATVTVVQGSASLSASGTGTITTGAANLPVITDVSTAFGKAEIAPNTWIAVKGTNLVPASTPAAGADWSSAASFAQGKMPTQLNGISVTINGVPGYISFYCSAATNPGCSSDQINVLTPLDNLGTRSPAVIVVTNGSASSAPFLITQVPALEPSFLLLNTTGYVVGVHLNSTLLGPATLYPGSSTPARVGETVLLFAIGFGLPAGNAVQGSSIQSGALPGHLNCSVGNRVQLNVPAAIISPGLAQINLTIPSGTASGDNLLQCGYATPNGSSFTPPGTLITVQ